MTADLAQQRANAARAFRQRLSAEPTLAAYAPGRVNLIGDHTDYTGGWVLPMTIHRGTHVLAAPRRDARLRVVAEGFGEASAALSEPPADRPLWQRYVLGAAREVAARAPEAPSFGAELYVTGDVPVGAGLSSSASLTVAVALALAGLWGAELSETEAALLAQRVEHVDAGVNCGIMDQVAVRSGRAGHAVLLDCQSLEHRPVGVASGVAIVIVNSGVGRSLAGSAYNKRREAVERAAEILGVPSLRDVTPGALDAHALGDLFPFARHVVTENARVQEAAEALPTDPERVGELMAASHASLRDDYHVSGPELDALVEIATGAGALGARLTGAGFGGCTVNLVPRERLDGFAERVREGYRERAGREAEVFVVEENREAGVVPLASGAPRS